jgi:hypothetical protein
LAWWGFDVENPERAQDRAYTSIVFSYLKMAFTLNTFSEPELRLTCEHLLTKPEVAAWWADFRGYYLQSQPRFGEIVDEAYLQLSQAPTTPEVLSPRANIESRRFDGRSGSILKNGLAFAAGAGACVGLGILVRLARRSRLPRRIS